MPTSEQVQLGRAIEAYAAHARRALGFETSAIVSYAGIWLLLASLSPVASGETRAQLAGILGMSVDEAAQLAATLAKEPHPTVAAALGAWVAQGIEVPLPTLPLPGQAELDAWASEHTRGLIRRFPTELEPDTGFVAASALVLEPRWRREMERLDDERMLMTDGLIAVVETRAAGPVAVAKPHSRDGVDVVSVQAAPEVAPDDVWRAVAEVSERLNTGNRLDRVAPERDGHSWTVGTEWQWLERAEKARPWKAIVREWGAAARQDLLTAPGVPEVVAALRVAEPQLDGPVQCVQSAIAEYGAEGFRAAAVTEIDLIATGAPMVEQREVRVVTLDFDRPHAVTAIARGGAWEGTRLFDAWVRPDLRPKGA